ncbi:hypothetical protein TSUD_354030 [Trifolium subterraneum]|uniref:TIR domain-containing protein n=1 Tax=Trifolium subterraneum TaxID=3900 RepID=A0A2Z6M244_TRISU|nr:hypothetical protein TSUD_354030 [Trifolium subterraneum]
MSSSSSSSNHPWIYDVFINFRGKDTRTKFVSHLYAALSNAGINTFIDDENLEKGEELEATLKRAIEGSQIAIVVISKYYAESSWCLNELVHIMECHKTYGQIVIPVFYYVDPSIVRDQRASFGDAMIFTARKRELLLSKWRGALTDVAGLAGWDANNFRGTESKLLQLIIKDILKKLDISLLDITEFPIGLESRVQQITNFIDDQSSKVCMIGIWGMGGSGKTTLAKAIYNKIQSRFKGRTSFIESIREVCSNNHKGIIHLQKQLISDLFKIKQNIHSIASGKTKIKTRLRRQKAFVVLDDVTKSDQLRDLCANPKLFGSRSVLIITTRDVRLLSSLKDDHIFTMMEMDKNQSLELFSWHVFRQPIPEEDFCELSKNVVAYCGGLPLALEVLGSYLYKRNKQEWRSALSKLEKIPNDQVQQKLRISYDGLEDYTLKDIFLDICCFFIGKKRADVTEILNGCGLHADIGIGVLIERSLVKVEKNNKLRMHDLIRDMGRAIVSKSSVKEPAKHSRLWFHEDVLDVLSTNTVTETVEGLVLKSQRTGRFCFNTDSFKEMKKLRLLQLDGVDLTGDYGYLSKQLRWVDWQRFTFNFIPNDFDQGNLVVFELKYSNVKQVWQETKLLQKLKILNVSHSKYLKNTPDFAKLPNLEKLIMKDCQSLSEVHPSIGDLKNLLLINFKDCTSLSNLPKEIYQLTSVKTLILSGCSRIDKLEEDIVQMESLTTLIAPNTSVKQVPFSIVRLKSIGYISLCGYEGLSHDVFPSIIRSWISPTMNSLAHIPPFGGMSMSLVSLNVDSRNSGLVYQSPLLGSGSTLRSVLIQCDSEIQLKQEFRRFLDDLHGAGLTEVGTSNASQISDLSLRSLLFGIGSCHSAFDTLGKSLSQVPSLSSHFTDIIRETNINDKGLSDYDSRDSFLPGDNYPSWLTYKCEGPLLPLQVPKNCDFSMKGITLCVIYSSTHENLATECLPSLLIINYKKFTIQIYKRDTVRSFNDEDWQGVISNLGIGDNVEIFVAIGHGFTVKETAVYLVYDQSNAIEIEPSNTIEVDPSTDTKIEPLHEVEVQPSPNLKMEPSLVVKNEPFMKTNRKIFTRLAKRVGNFDKDKMARIAMILWTLWWRRNQRCWKNKIPTIFEAIRRARDSHLEWLKAQLRNMKIDHGSVTSTSYCWSKPSAGKLKCNVDTAYYKEDNVYCVGLCIRERMGSLCKLHEKNARYTDNS